MKGENRPKTAGHKAVPHDSARGHVTGAALYVDDLPRLEGELCVDFLPSPCAHGELKAIDTNAALAIDGVIAVYTAKDIPGVNHFGPIIQDEPCLVEREISYRGQPLAIVAAIDRETAARARAALTADVEELEPVLTLEEANSLKQYIGPRRYITRGDLEVGWQRSTHCLEGTFTCRGQDHFYLESQAALSWSEEGQIRIHSSTQNPTEIQTVIAEVLGLGQHQVVCVVKRMGGAFGGKETQAALPALFAALVTHKTGRPARVVYSKDDDMAVTGKRHEVRARYRIGFDDDGLIHAAELSFRSNGGAFADLSTAVLERTMLHADNAYYLPNVAIEARVCRTHLPPNTAFRGFGGPQGMSVIENALQGMAIRLGVDALELRRRNLYEANLDIEEEPATTQKQRRTTTPYGQVVRNNLLPEIFSRLAESARYEERREVIAQFNARSKTHLRGLALTPVKFGISFTTKFLNQGNALVNLYTDGTVQVSTGATEMGQGVNTKIAQLVAAELAIPLSHVVVMQTSTEKNPNTSPTAASASTDLNGTAAVRACQTLRRRLAAFAASLFADPSAGLSSSARDVRFEDGFVFDRRDPDRRLSFAELAASARRERVDLGARGFYATPGIDFNRETGRGHPFFYFTTGAACAEVLIDRLLGELKIERLQALMDVGRVLNEGIERGQAIGGLIQGVGWVTTEELVYGPGGELLTVSPTTYKIPNISDLPEGFKVDFLDNDLNRQNLSSSKAVGEPPLMLGLSVWAAIHDALSFVAPGEIPGLGLPATHEEILHTLSTLEAKKRTDAKTS